MAKVDNKGPLETILSATIDGLAKGDLSGLNDAVESSVESVINSVEDTFFKAGNIDKTGNAKPFPKYDGRSEFAGATRERQEYIRRRQLEREAQRARERDTRLRNLTITNVRAPFNEVGSVSSVLNIVFGSIGTVMAGFSTMVNGVGYAIGAGSLGSFIGAGIISAVSVAAIALGINQRKRLKRAKRIGTLCGEKMYMPIEDLAAATNTSVRKMNSDIRMMLKKGFFPEGHVDNEKTTLMLKDSVYDEYLRVAKERKALSTSENVFDTTAREVDSQSEDAELNAIMREGSEYIDKLHKLNDEIPAELISNRLDRLENLLKDIFGCLKKHPEQRSRMHEVMNYYLPTVLKLVEAYKEYDSISEPGPEILDAKNQIEGSIDTINEALKTMLNKLFRDSVWDVTTDATVLNTMLAQKGLTKASQNQHIDDNDAITDTDNI